MYDPEMRKDCPMRGNLGNCSPIGGFCMDAVSDEICEALHNAYDRGFYNAARTLKEQEPKTPIHIHEEYPEHDWETDADGKIDEWAMSYEYHNGPVCKRCYHSFCIHCEPNGFNDGPCVIDEYKCPKCGCILPKGTKFCSECGQAVKWNV